jgi:hypothetical protein
MICGLLLGEALRAGKNRESRLLGQCGPLMRGTATCGEEALAFGAVRSEGFVDDSASCLVPVRVELGHGWMGACTSNVRTDSARWHMGHVSELVCPYRLARFWLWMGPDLSLSVVVWMLGVGMEHEAFGEGGIPYGSVFQSLWYIDSVLTDPYLWCSCAISLILLLEGGGVSC